MLRVFGARMEAAAGLLLIAFGLVYAAYGLRRTAGAHLHGHEHHHYDHVHDARGTTAWALFLLFSADPCVAVVPILFAPRRWERCARRSSSSPTRPPRSRRWCCS